MDQCTLSQSKLDWKMTKFNADRKKRKLWIHYKQTNLNPIFFQLYSTFDRLKIENTSLRNRQFQKLTRRERNWERVRKIRSRLRRSAERRAFFPPSPPSCLPLSTSPHFFAHYRRATSLARSFARLFELRLGKETTATKVMQKPECNVSSLQGDWLSLIESRVKGIQ